MHALPRWLFALALCWHALSVIADAWPEVSGPAGAKGRDFASYYYAARVAQDGGDPYDKGALTGAARADGTRATVHPFFYPPPFLLLVAWAPSLPLHDAARIWFWADEAALLIATLSLLAWTGPLGGATPLAVAAFVAALTAIPNNHVMGQANLLPFAAAMAGLLAARRGRELLGGALVGAACMWKMSPALLVAWWALQGRWRAVAGSLVAAALLSVATGPWVGPAQQWHFYRDVLPGFATGDYNGLTVPIALFGNHSLPNLIHQLAPGSEHGLSPTARALSGAVALVLLGLTTAAVRRPATDGDVELAQVGAVCTALLLLPVYTYEHHLVWTLPAATAIVAGARRLGPVETALAGASLAVLAFDLSQIRGAAETSRLPGLGEGLQEAKTAALVIVWALCARLGRAR